MVHADINHYGLRLAGVTQEVEEFPTDSNPVQTTLIIRSTMIGDAKIEKFASDMTIMNEVRKSFDPAVKEAYEQLLTVMALTKGREIPANDDELKGENEKLKT